MAQVVVEDEGAESKRRGDAGRHTQRRDRRELIDEVVGQHQGGVAEAFDLADFVDELDARRRVADPGRESERFHATARLGA